jgi:hypothetical protein
LPCGLRRDAAVLNSGITIIVVSSENVSGSKTVVGWNGTTSDGCVCADRTHKLYEVHAAAAADELALLRRAQSQRSSLEMAAGW